MAENETCISCEQPADDTRIIDGFEQPIYSTCDLAWDIMNDTRMPADMFDTERTARLRHAARDLAQKVLDRE